LNFENRVISLETDSEKPPVGMWLLDFNRCHMISMDEKGVEQAVKAFFRNGPYYSR
jgi:hypothetical protein